MNEIWESVSWGLLLLLAYSESATHKMYDYRQKVRFVEWT